MIIYLHDLIRSLMHVITIISLGISIALLKNIHFVVNKLNLLNIS